MNDTTQVQATNPLLDRLRIPGETYRLPSQGLFYSDGELDESVRNGEVEVYPMTAMDEIILSTPDKLLSGKAMSEVLARCVPSVCKPEGLLSKDVDFLMACLRAVSFGASMTVNYTHNCKDAKVHEYDVKLDQIIKTAKAIDPTTMKTDFDVMMPNGQNVLLTPLTYGSVIALYQTTAMIKTDEDLSAEEARSLIVGTLTSVIKSVDGDSDKQHIEEWVTQIPIGWKRMIESAAQKNNAWGIDFTSKHVCKDCGEEVEIEVTANPVSFFS